MMDRSREGETLKQEVASITRLVSIGQRPGACQDACDPYTVAVFCVLQIAGSLAVG